MESCHLSNSSVSTLKEKKKTQNQQLERKLVRLNAAASSFLALSDSESTAASRRKKKKVVFYQLCPFVFTQGVSFSFGITSSALMAARSLRSSCAAAERLPAPPQRNIWKQTAVVQQRTEQDPFIA